MGNKLQVKKSNFLVPLEEAVSKPAQLLASYLVASLPKSSIEAERLPQLKFSYTELRRAINADGKERVNKVQDIMKLGVELQRCVLFYEDNVSERTVTWLIDQERNKQTNAFTYSLHPGLKKYLTNLEKHFTKYNYLFRVCLNAHSMKLYEILKMYQYRGEVILHIEDDLKPSLSLTGKYPKIYDLKRRVLDVVQKEVEKYTDIRFEYEVSEKKGKTPISFLFKIYANQPTDLPAEILDKLKAEGGIPQLSTSTPNVNINFSPNKDYPKIYATLEQWGGKGENIANLIETYKSPAIEYQIIHLQRVLKAGKKQIKNPFAWLVKALKEDYRDTVQDQKGLKKIKAAKKQKEVSDRGALETELKQLEKVYFQEKSAHCDVLIKEQPSVLEQVVNSMRGNISLRKGFATGYTPAEMYQDKWMRFSIQREIEEQYSDSFKSLEQQFGQSIAKLKRQLGLM